MDTSALIEQYFEGSLDERGKAIFKKLRDTDPAFAEELSFHENLKQAITAEQEAALRKQIEGYEAEADLAGRSGGDSVVPIERGRKRTIPKVWWIAAAIAIIASFGGLYLLNNGPSNQKLFAQNFEPYRNVVMPIERGEEIPDAGISSKEKIVQDAFRAYEKGEFGEALAFFDKVDPQTAENYTLFYRAICELKVAKTDLAISHFQEYVNTGESQFKEQSDWYLALAYLQNDDAPKAVEALLPLVEDQSSFMHEKAVELSEKLQ